MAKRRLNKKVALIGSAVFVLLVLVVIGAILHLSRDPGRFIKDGDAALLAKDYEKAERNYHKARSLAKTDELRIEMLFKLADIYIKTNRWRDVLGCWNQIIRIDPKNAEARFGRSRYVYIMADSGARQAWQEVATQASEFIEVVEKPGAPPELLMEDIAKWEPSFGIQERGAGAERLGPYLYLLRGRATLEMAKLGAVTDPDASLSQAIDDLEKVLQFEPANVDAYLYLAQVVLTRGEVLASRGNFEERDKAAEQALELLEQAVKAADDDPKAHINLLLMKLVLAQSGGAMPLQEQIQFLEPQYLSLVDRFPSCARAHSVISRFYSDPRLGPKNLDRAVEAAQIAMELDKENVTYAMNAANLHYRRFSIDGQKPEIYKAIEVAKNALNLPNAQDKPGPRQWANRMNRASLYVFLANCYIEQVLEPCEVRTQAQSQQWLTNAEQAVYEIEQLLGSGEDLRVVKWRGMLELAKGNTNLATRKLYEAYEQLKASGQKDARLSYALAKVFKNTSEVGVVVEFLASALNAGIGWTKPQVCLDYAEVLLRLNAWTGAISNINSFEENFGPNERSQALRIKALIGARQFDEAEEQLANQAEPDGPDAIKLNLELVQAKIGQVQRAVAQKQIRESSPIFQWLSAEEEAGVDSQATARLMADELRSYKDALAKLVGKLLRVEPNSVGEAAVATVCDNYITEGEIEQAEAIVDRFLEHFPTNITALFYKQILSEPQPDKISQQRRKEIEEQILSNIADPIRRAMNLGIFYRRNNEPNEAAGEFKKVLKIEASQEGIVEESAFDQTEEITDLQGTQTQNRAFGPSQRLAVDYLFRTALESKDWELAEQVAEIGRRENLDNCQGQFFAAYLAVAKEEYKDALAELEEVLRQRPVFSEAYMLKSKTEAALGNEHASIESAQKAASLNPLDGAIAKNLAFVLYRRNQKLGDNVSTDQIIETRLVLDRAVALNPGDMELRSFYAEYIVPIEPLRALAIRQSLQKTVPSMQNAILLGQLATRMALRTMNAERREALFAIAASSFEQAQRINPQDEAMLLNYAEHYRVRGQEKEAEQLLLESGNQKLLWSYYFRSGRFEDTRKILERLYQSDEGTPSAIEGVQQGQAKDSDVVKGLLLVAERTADKENTKKYSEELLSLEDSVENRLIQIQTFLKIGLVKEAEYKLQSFKEKYPDEPRAMLLGAWLAMKQGRFKKALELTNQNLETDQNNALAWRVRGEINLLMANYDQAILDLKKSKLLAAEPATRIALAKAYLGVGREEDAITELKSAIDTPGAPIEGRELLERLYLQLGRKAALRRFYGETLQRFPDSVRWYNRAGAFAIAEGRFDRAEQLYGLAWQNGKGDADSLDGYLQALVLGGQLDKVFEEAGKYVDGDLAPIAYLRMAEAKLKLDDGINAVEYCRKAIAKAFEGTDEIFASEILQRIHSLLGAEEVLKYCKEKLETNPDSLTANLTMFNLAKIDGEYNKALDYIDRCLEITAPNSPRRVDYMVKRTEVLGMAYGKTSDNNYLKRAIAAHESLLVKMPNNANILNNLAYMLAENNERLTEALVFAKRALRVRPNSPAFLDTYAYVLYKNRKFQEAAEFAQSALQQYEQNKIPMPAEVYDHLGQIHEELGAEAQALAAYKQALEAGADKLPKLAKQRITSAIERLSMSVESKK